MDKKKMIYIGSLLILTAIISIASFSYAIWSNKSEQRGKLNIVAGNLNYELVSSDLTNNSITIPANTSKTIEIEITSLNNIESKYELYYQTDSSIIIGYSLDTIDNPTGIIGQRSSKKVTVTIKNRSSSPATITFGCQGGFSSEELVLVQGTSIPQISNCEYQPGAVVKAAGYTGSADPFEVPCDGYYKVELWGAQGGSTSLAQGGHGGYVKGNISFASGTKLYLYIGSMPTLSTNSYNGGGNTNNSYYPTADGGGATDIRYFDSTAPSTSDLEWNSSLGLNSRIMVAAGGGGAENFSTGANGASGGGLIGYTGNYTGTLNNYTLPTGGTQASGGVRDSAITAENGFFGKGGNGNLSYGGGAGGSGYYGGGGGSNMRHVSSGGGGSSFISGHTGCVAIAEGSTTEPRTVRKSGCTTGTTDNECSIHYSRLYFTDTLMIDGSSYSWTNQKNNSVQMPNYNGGYYSSGGGNTGNGYARITYLGEGTSATIYSAANDEIYFKDKNNNKVTIGTTDSAGKLENAFVPDGEIIYSSVAKDPNNLSNSYSKTFSVIGNEVYLMPDGNILYWYGYKSDNLESAVAANGWAFGSYTIYEPTYYTNYITCSPAGTNWNRVSSVGTKNAVTASKIQSIINLNNVSNNSLSMRSSKDLGSSSTVNYIQTGIPNTGLQYLVAEEPTSYTGYIIQNFSAASGNVYALWYE